MYIFNNNSYIFIRSVMHLAISLENPLLQSKPRLRNQFGIPLRLIIILYSKGLMHLVILLGNTLLQPNPRFRKQF